MKKWPLIAAIMQLCIGIAAVAANTVIAIGGEPLGKWTVTLLLCEYAKIKGPTTLKCFNAQSPHFLDRNGDFSVSVG